MATTTYRRADIEAMDETARFKLAKELGIPGAAMMGTTDLKNAVIATLIQRGALTDGGSVSTVVGASAAAPAAAAQVQTAFVAYPPHSQELACVGKTIERLVADLRGAWSIDAGNLRVFLNGVDVPRAAWGTTTIPANGRVEMQRPAGEKA